MRHVTFECDQCKCTIRPMHMGLQFSPLAGATDIGDWRGVKQEFCSVTCAVNFMMDNWPRQETVSHQTGQVGAMAFINGIKQGVISKKAGVSVIRRIAEVLNIYKVIRAVAEIE